MSSPQEAVAGLLEVMSTPLSRNDLGRLAQMHSWAQGLVEAETLTDDASVDAVMKRLAESLVALLERLILDEAADPDLGLALVPQLVGLLDQALRGETVQPESVLAEVARASGCAPCSAAGEAAPPPASPPPATPAAPPPPVMAAPAEPAAPAQPASPGSSSADEVYVSEPLIIDMDEREHLEGFLEEATEHMDNIETGLLDVETNPSDTDKLNELFRPFHTIKGIAGFLNLRDINRLTHEIETILDQGRKGTLQVTAVTVDLIFAAVDVLKAQLQAIRAYLANPTGSACPQPEIGGVMARLRRAAAGQTDAAADSEQPRLGEVMVAQGDATKSDVDAALEVQARGESPARRLGEILVDGGVTTDERVKRALTQQQETTKAALDSSIRVDTAKLDTLVDAVGELVIAQSMVSLSDKIHEDDKLNRNVSQVSKIVRDVQETAMSMRMVPIGQTFQKMRRLVRDVARKAGKSVELVISGEDTELDKNVIQQISDPLVHLVRNAVDHGVEPPLMRHELGKPEDGVVQLNAYHQGDSIVIEIRDDGKGLDKDQLIAKGIERGLISSEDQLSEQQAFALILQAGFSTAEKVTDISGRGVGMDVVKRNVEQLRGKIDIHSEKGKGSLFSIRLPLTLAIIDGMLVRVGSERLIIPTILIEQSLQPERKQINSVQNRGQMIQVRGELCPLIQLGALFNYSTPVDPCENLVVIVQAEGQKIALVVEELIGQQQVVIKTLGGRFKQLRGVSGAAILGDGRVGLILEPSGILALHNLSGCAAFTATASKPVEDVACAAMEPGLLEPVGTVPPGADEPEIDGQARGDDENAEHAEPQMDAALAPA